MKNQFAENIESLDHQSSQSIRDSVGERLQQILRPVSTDMSPHLQHLIDELRQRDEAGDLKSN